MTSNMTRRLHRWACVLLCTLLTSIGLQAEVTPSITNLPSESLRTGSDGVITMTTSSPVGQHIMLAVSPVEGQTVIAEGLQESLILDGQPHRYTLTSQTVTLRGDVTFLECGKHHRDPQMFCYNRLTSLDISGCKSLETLICQGNDLTSLDVSQNPALKYLACGYNQLSTLDVSYNPALKRLDCYSNKIKREEMTQLVNGLHDRQGKEAGFFVVHSIFPEDETRCLKSDVAIAKAKNWDVVQVSAIDGYGRYRFEPYEGEDDSQPSVGDGVITMTTARAVGEDISFIYLAEGDVVIEGATGTPKENYCCPVKVFLRG